jgi:hypothetical protein
VPTCHELFLYSKIALSAKLSHVVSEPMSLSLSALSQVTFFCALSLLLSSCNTSSVEDDLALLGGLNQVTVAATSPSATVQRSPEIENLPLPESADIMIGRWYTKGSLCTPPLDYDALVVRRADGYYTCDFNYGAEGRRVLAEGRWSRSGSSYKVQTLKSGDSYLSSQDPMHLIEYEVDKAEKDEVIYRSRTSGKVFKSQRVTDDFVLPTYSTTN